jgi:hypothetical protein
MRYVVQNNINWIITENSSYVSPNGTQYPSTFPKTGLSGLSTIIETTEPDIDPKIQAKSASIQLVNGVYTNVWTVRDLTEAELAAIELARLAEIKARQPIQENKVFRVNKMGHDIISQTPKQFTPRQSYLII